MFKQTVCVLAFCLFFFSRTISGDERDFQEDLDSLIDRGFEKAAIIGLDGNTYAISPQFVLLPGEVTALTELFNNPSDDSTEIFISGIRYTGFKGRRSDSIYGMKGNRGAICVKTNKLILIGVYDSRLTLRRAVSVVETQGDYLKDIGY